MNPVLGIYTALTRGSYLSPEEAISLEKAIEVGKLVDIIILSDNLFEIPTDKVKDVEVLLTIVGGKEIYRLYKF